MPRRLFTALTAYYNRTGDDSIEGLRGLAETQPFLAMIITASLFSFAGLPFFAGFTTKLFMFQASVTGDLLWLIGLAVANSFVSLYYYLMIMKRIYLFGPENGLTRFKVGPVLWIVGAALMLGVLFIGVYPQPAFKAAENATSPLFSESPRP
jgi:NADH-quinone oxidoreductase subunit N